MKLYKVIFFLVCLFLTGSVFAQSSAELKKRRDKLNEELDELNAQYQEAAKSKKTTLKQLNLLKAQISVREDKISTINSEVRLLDNQILESNKTVHSLQSQLDQLKKEYAAMIVFAYHNQSAYNKLMFVFASNDFNQAYKRLKYLQEFGNYRQRQAESIQGTQKDLHVKINQLDRTKKEKSNLLADQEKEKETLGKEQNNQIKVIADISKQQGQIKKQQKDLIKKIAATQRELRAAINREIAEARRRAEEEAARRRAEEARAAAARAAAERAKTGDNSGAATAKAPAPVSKPVARSSTSEVLTATPEAAKLSNDFLGNKGRLPWPVSNGVVTQEFGIYYIEGIKTDNTGIDIRTGSSAAVRAVFNGDVANVLDVSGTYLVLIRHGEYFTAYSNLKSVSVSKGQKVNTKEVIGTAAIEPSTGETQVHFDLYKAQTPVNPRSWLAPN